VRTTRTRSAVMVSGLLLPLIVLGALLGIVVGADTALERVPVALVNNDEIIETTSDDGEEEFFFASKPLVTELVSGSDINVDWVVTDTETAETLLATGEVYAVLEIPDTFSEAVQTLGDPEPTAAEFTISTDPSHSYLAGVLADQVGATIAATISDEFGKEVTKGLFTAVVDLGDAITEAADAAVEVADGTAELADGVADLKDGTADLEEGTVDLASGYATFDDGLEEYLGGVRDLADGLEEFNDETKSLPQLSDGISQYTSGVSQVATGLKGLNDAGTFAGVPTDPNDPTSPGTILQTLIATLTALGTSGSTLATQTDTAIDGVRDGIVAVDKGADALAEASYDLESGSDEIRSGTADLAEGVEELDDGVGELSDGVVELADGMQEFADGLSEGADEIADQGFSEPSDSTLDTLTNPVAFDAQDRAGTVGLAPTLASVLIPAGMWLVVLAFFLLSPTPSTRALSGTSASSRVMARTLGRTLTVAAVQSAVAVALIHSLAGVSWSLIGLTSAVVVTGVAALSLVHLALWWWLPRSFATVSLIAAVVQIVTLGVVIPEQLLPGLYQSISGITPMAWFADGLLAVVASGDSARVVGSIVALAALALASVAVTAWAVRSRRLTARRELIGLR
jgi:putative membrane protein